MERLDLILTLAGVAVGFISSFASPVLRRVIRETFAHPRMDSIVVRDRRTGEVTSRTGKQAPTRDFASR